MESPLALDPFCLQQQDMVKQHSRRRMTAARASTPCCQCHVVEGRCPPCPESTTAQFCGHCHPKNHPISLQCDDCRKVRQSLVLKEFVFSSEDPLPAARMLGQHNIHGSSPSMQGSRRVVATTVLVKMLHTWARIPHT